MPAHSLLLGCSLPFDYLAGDEILGVGARPWHEAFGSAGACLDELRRAGIRSVELRAVGPDADPARALHAACRVWDAGMALTVHGQLPRSVSGDTWAEVYPSLLPLAEALAARGHESVVTVHCYSSDQGDVRTLAERTVRSLRGLLDAIERDAIPLRVALENNHVGAHVDPGLTYDGVCDMVERASSSRIGTCWDLGHAYMNVQHGVDVSGPDVGFLRQVIHTHVHDLGPRTHCALTHGVVPLDRYLDALIGEGYRGVLNLELSPERFAGAVKESVRASIDRLVDYGRRRRRYLLPSAQRGPRL